MEFSHPFHLHGSHFWVLGSGNGTFSAECDGDSLNFEDPRHADTQTVGSYGWAYLRFRPDNPGVWPLHCHIAVHEFGGMLLLFAHDVDVDVDVDSIPKLKIEAGVLPTCPSECVYSAKLYNETYNETTTSAAGGEKLVLVAVAGLLLASMTMVTGLEFEFQTRNLPIIDNASNNEEREPYVDSGPLGRRLRDAGWEEDEEF